MSIVSYWIIWVFWRIVFFVCHAVASFCYKGRGKIVPPIKKGILLKSAVQLAEDIRDRKLKSEEVVQAYIDRIQEVEPYLNAVVQDNFQGALLKAKEVDVFIQSGKFMKSELRKTKPLLGIPFTVKMLLQVKGFKNTGGSLLHKDEIAKEDAKSVTLLKEAGGIFLAITNAPEFGFALETNNLLYGRTCNPYDTSKTSGGSSGGESALLGAGASLIGLGNDLGGSVRIPAHFTGVFGHKPTVGIVPNDGTFVPSHPKVSSFIYTGPMCRYAEDLIELMKILAVNNTEQLNFNRKINFKKLKIFYATSVNDPKTLPVSREIKKEMHKAISYFETTYGVMAKERNIPLLDQSCAIICHLLQEKVPQLAQYLTSNKVTEINVVSEMLKCILGRSEFSFTTTLMLAIDKFHILYDARNTAYYKVLFEKLIEQFDALLDEDSVFIYPTFPVTAPFHYEMIVLLGSVIFTQIFNMIGLPSTNCPIGFDRNGMPIGIQIIGRRNNDALTLACAQELSKAFNGWIPPGSR